MFLADERTPGDPDRCVAGAALGLPTVAPEADVQDVARYVAAYQHGVTRPDGEVVCDPGVLRRLGAVGALAV